MKLLKLNSGGFDLSFFLTKEEKGFISDEEGVIEVIVGWEIAKQRGASILNHKINETTYWTFLPTEKRKIFKEHINELKITALNFIKSNKNTINIDPLSFDTKGDLILYIQKEFRDCMGYLFNDRIYIYDGDNIYHLDVGLLNFMSWDIINDIKDIIELREIIEEDYSEYSKYIDIKYIPYLLNAKENTISRDVC